MLGTTGPLGSAEAHWNAPFRVVGSADEAYLSPPPRVLDVTRTAWTALQHPSADQFVPGLDPLGQALVVRNLALSLPGRPRLVVQCSDRTARAYHYLEHKLLGRWASKYPMFYLGPDGKEKPISRRGLGKTQPRPIVYRSVGPGATTSLAAALRDACVLVFADGPEAVPRDRNGRTHVVLLGTFAREAAAFERLRRPCKTVLPSGPWTATPEAPAVVDLAERESNVVDFRLNIAEVASDEVHLARLHDAYRNVAKAAWRTHAAFVGIAGTVVSRLSCDLFTERTAPPETRSTDALVAVLRNMVRTGDAPSLPDSHSLVGEAAVVLQERRSKAPRKATWFSQFLETAAAEMPDVIVDSEHTAARGRKQLRTSSRGSWTRYVRVEPYTALKQPRSAPVLVGCPARPILLQALAAGATPSATLLLYPWEHAAHNAALRYLRWCSAQVGADWPQIPVARDVAVDTGGVRVGILVPRDRTEVDFDQAIDVEDAEAAADEQPVVLDAAPRPRVGVETLTARHLYPRDRQVVVLRAERFHEIEAAHVHVGDILVTHKGGAAPSASDVVARICKRDARMDNTRTLASVWRRLLRDHANDRYAGASVADVHRGLGLSVTYHQFRHWLEEGDPVTPTLENLKELVAALDYEEALALTIHGQGLDHKNDRRRIFEHILNLATSRLDALFGSVDKDMADETYGITTDDILAVVELQKVTKVEQNAQ